MAFAPALLAAASLSSGPDLWPGLDARVQAALRHLTPADLSLSRARLARRIDALGRGTGLFTLRHGNASPGYLTKVDGASREWTVVLQVPRDEMVPCAGYWIGARGRTVRTTLLPDSAESLEGPLVGEWRRRGSTLLAAGYNLAFHSPNFTNGSYLVYAERPEGLELLQKGNNWYVKEPIVFRSSKSDDLLVRDGEGDFRTLDGRRDTAPTRRIVLRLHKGHYVQVGTRTVHDRLWAFDQLATAVAKRRRREVARMVPSQAARPALIRELHRALAKGQDRITDTGDGWLGLWGPRDDGDGASPLSVRFVLRRGRWIVNGVRVE